MRMVITLAVVALTCAAFGQFGTFNSLSSSVKIGDSLTVAGVTGPVDVLREKQNTRDCKVSVKDINTACLKLEKDNLVVASFQKTSIEPLDFSTVNADFIAVSHGPQPAMVIILALGTAVSIITGRKYA